MTKQNQVPRGTANGVPLASSRTLRVHCPPPPGPRRGPAHAVLHRLPPPAGHRGHVAAGGGEPEALAPHAQVLLVSQVSLGQDGGRVARCQVTAAASPAQRMGASPLPPVDGTSGRLAGEKSSVPEPALLLSGHVTLDTSSPPLEPELPRQRSKKAALILWTLGRTL